MERSRFIKERNNYSTTLLHGVEYIGYTLLLEYVWNGICATPEWTQDWIQVSLNMALSMAGRSYDILRSGKW